MSLYERFTFRGKTLDRMTIAALLAAEKRLGYDNTIVQGSYNTGVGASAGTHDGGGAVDLRWRLRFVKHNRAMRKWGHFAGWPRFTLPNVWSAHWHGILIGNDKASAGAKAQVAEYRAGFDGLAGSGRDRWWRPSPITEFNYKRAALVSWRRFNELEAKVNSTAETKEGRRQVETVARALRGFGMSLHGHRKGHADQPLVDAINRFRRIRNVGPTEVKGPLTPQVCYELCIPTVEED